MPEQKTLIVSNRLPIKIQRRKGKLKFTTSEGGLATGLGSFYKEQGSWWLGWAGIVPKNADEEHEIRQELRKHNLIPVFLDQTEIEGFYEGFSNGILWPLCHYRPSYMVLKQEHWLSYCAVNAKFAKTALEQLSPGMRVWVHDYQLMLLPALLREQLPDASIGYFHHIPFPAMELFKMLPWREELLTGLLGADLVGFHTFENVDNFLDSCFGILNLPKSINQLKVKGRSVLVDVFPMGIDYDKYHTQAKLPPTTQYADNLRKLYRDQKIILSVDRLDYSKGILQRLQAFEILLNDHPEWRQKIVLHMLIVPSRDQVGQYKKLRNEIDRTVGNINAVYGRPGWQPIAYYYNSLPFPELAGLYVAADICLITSLYDGMNLVSKEYLASKNTTTGVLVISEFAGASKELADALVINPYAIHQTSETLLRAIKMPKKEQQERLQASQAILSKFTVHHWVKLFMQRLGEIKSQQRHELARKVNQKISHAVKERYDLSLNRLILLDYDGTLVGFNTDADKATPTDDVYEVLDLMAEDTKNTLSIVSGRKYNNLEEWFGQKNYYAIAEHGIWSNFPTHTWQLAPGLQTNWKAQIKEILQRYADRTPSAYIEEKTHSLAWHYRKVERAYGLRQAQELLQELLQLTQEKDLQLINGDRVIEIKSKQINKGKAALALVNEIKPDFILCIGDDATDEDMFQSLPQHAVTIKVGDKQSHAKYYVENYKEVIDLLSILAN